MERKFSLSKNIQPSYTNRMEKAFGVCFWDSEGKQYTDLSSQNFNLLFGQCHSTINNACIEILQQYTYFDKRFDHSIQHKAIEELSEILPSYFTCFNIRLNDTSDALECAIKVARRYRQRSKILTIKGIYLGQSQQTILLRGVLECDSDILGKYPEDVIFAPQPYVIGQKENLTENPNDIIKIIEDNESLLACVIFDPILMGSAVVGGEQYKQYLKTVSKICQSRDIPVIFDECQTYGWVNNYVLCQEWDIPIDIIVLGKGIANGLPIAVCAFKEKFNNLIPGEADFTHGGSPISLAALIATAQLLKSEKEISHFDNLCRTFSNVIKSYIFPLGNIFRFRQVGLIGGLELLIHENTEFNINLAQLIVDEAFNKGIVIRCRYNTLIFKISRAFKADDLKKTLENLCSIINNEINKDFNSKENLWKL